MTPCRFNPNRLCDCDGDESRCDSVPFYCLDCGELESECACAGFPCCECGCCDDEDVTEGSCVFCGLDDCCGCGACDDSRIVCVCDEPTAGVPFSLPVPKAGTITIRYLGF